MLPSLLMKIMSKPLICALMTIAMWPPLTALTVSVKHMPSLFSVGLVLLVAAIPRLRYRWTC